MNLLSHYSTMNATYQPDIPAGHDHHHRSFVGDKPLLLTGLNTCNTFGLRGKIHSATDQKINLSSRQYFVPLCAYVDMRWNPSDHTI